MQRRGIGHVPLIGNVFLLSPSVLRFFRRKSIPGVVISDELMDHCRRHAEGRRSTAPASSRSWQPSNWPFFAAWDSPADIWAAFTTIESLQAILDLESSFAEDDWKQFAREIRFPVEDEFYYFAEDPATGLADASRLSPDLRRVARQNARSSQRHRQAIASASWCTT